MRTPRRNEHGQPDPSPSWSRPSTRCTRSVRATGEYLACLLRPTGAPRRARTALGRDRPDENIAASRAALAGGNRRVRALLDRPDPTATATPVAASPRVSAIHERRRSPTPTSCSLPSCSSRPPTLSASTSRADLITHSTRSWSLTAGPTTCRVSAGGWSRDSEADAPASAARRTAFPRCHVATSLSRSGTVSDSVPTSNGRLTVRIR